MAATTDFVSAQKANRRNTLMLLAVLTALAALVGYVIGWLLESEASDAVPAVSQAGVAAAGLMAAVSVGWSAISLAFGDKMVLAMANAKQIDKADAPQLYNVVEEMAIAAGIPMPKVMVLETDALNAFATGNKPGNGTIAVTRGLLNSLSRDELQGVVAHEMSHIRNDDVKLMTLLAGMLGAVALLSDTMGRYLRSGGRVGVSSRGGSGRSGGKGGNSLGAVLLVLWVFSLLIAPVVTRLLAMAVSRKREYLADATAAQFTRNPGALARALEKLDASTVATRSVTQGAAHLCIVDPGERKISDREGLFGDIFASHPPIRLRVARLKAMAFQSASREGLPLPA
jgi:heat shock protein HtpX